MGPDGDFLETRRGGEEMEGGISSAMTKVLDLTT